MSRKRMGMTSVLVGGWSTFLQVHPVPVSSMQVELQPSPEIVLPSSHCSPAKTSPSPQTPEHPPLPLHFGSILVSAGHPAYRLGSPASQLSTPSLLPSPQWLP